MRCFIFIGAAMATVCLASPFGSSEPESVVSLNHPGAAAVRNAAPQVALAARSSTMVALTIAVPSMRCARIATRQGAYTTLALDGCGPTDTVGQPALPVVRRLLVAPMGATVTVDVQATPTVQAAPALSLDAPPLPRQNPVPKLSGKIQVPFVRDAAAYASDSWFPRAQVRVTEAGVFAGRRLVLIEYAPVRYNPGRNEYALSPTASLVVKFEGGTQPTEPLSPREDSQLAALALNHTATSTPKSGGRLLIIAHDPFVASLASFVAHKATMGWSVVLTNATAAGSSESAIRSFIRTLYTTPATRPDMVLLVGDVPQIPCFTGVGDYDPDTDLYYGCMDGASDWQPELPVGRFSVHTTGQLAAVVDKTIAYETGSRADWYTRACFMASADNFTVSEGTHNWVINTYMTPQGYTSDKLYCHSYAATRAQVSNAFNAGRALGIYSGHGSETMWADGPVFGQADVRGLINSGSFPFVGSFACLTGEMGLDECFAETWLRTPGIAAISVWASSVYSYWDQDDILERRLFSALYDDNAMAFGAATMRAKQLFLAYYGPTDPMTRSYFEQYNLFGDPTVMLVPPHMSITTPSPLPTGFTGEQYRCTLDAAGGTPPYTNWSLDAGTLPAGLALNPTNGVIEGFPTVPGTSAFSVRLDDSAGDQCSGSFSLAVLARLSIKPGLSWPSPTNLPEAKVNELYSLSLDAQGGTPPYTWTLLPQQEWYDELVTAMRVRAKKTAQQWRADDLAWPLALPHPFPFYGQSHTSLWVSSNGFVDFGSASPSPLNSTADLIANKRIAPLWLDLSTDRGNIYVYAHPTSTFTLVRWKARIVATKKMVNVSLYLYTNGMIRCAYGSKLTVPSPTIGVANGDSIHYTLSSLNATSSIPRTTVSTLSYTTINSSRLSFAGAVLAGTPTQLGTSTLSVVVCDAGSPRQSVTNNLVFSVVP